jgi:hypothetical protein
MIDFLKEVLFVMAYIGGIYGFIKLVYSFMKYMFKNEDFLDVDEVTDREDYYGGDSY